jgi:hypothetical protein
MMVWPSGAALATSTIAGMPAPPPLLSTNTVWPSCLLSSTATVRATISEVPPGAKGTTKRIDWRGQLEGDCAWPSSARPAPAAKVAVMALRRVMVMANPD